MGCKGLFRSVACGCLAWSVMAGSACGQEKVKTLVVTGGEVHDWKNIGRVVEEGLTKTGKFEVTRVEDDLNALKAENVNKYDLVVFYWTLGEITDEQKRGILDHVAGGKGFVTFHSGADSFRGDTDWHDFVGGHFVTHPRYRQFQVSITEKAHPITKGIEEFMITDEQYILDCEKSINVLANGLYKGKTMPAVWTKPHGKGRVFYMSFGHDPKACKQAMFQKLLIRGALWAAGRKVVDRG